MKEKDYKEQNTQKSGKEDKMKHIVRAGLGLVSGLFLSLGIYSFSFSWIVGIISIIAGLAIVYYAYKG